MENIRREKRLYVSLSEGLFPPQLRMDGLLVGVEEGIPVDVEDRPRP